MIINWIVFIIEILFGLLLIYGIVDKIKENKQARFPNWFTPILYATIAICSFYVAFRYMP